MVRTITDISRESWSAGTCRSDCLEERLTAAMAGTGPQPALEKQTLQKRRNPCRDGCGFLLSFIGQTISRQCHLAGSVAFPFRNCFGQTHHLWVIDNLELRRMMV
jgi:hypothetical protein